MSPGGFCWVYGDIVWCQDGLCRGAGPLYESGMRGQTGFCWQGEKRLKSVRDLGGMPRAGVGRKPHPGRVLICLGSLFVSAAVLAQSGGGEYAQLRVTMGQAISIAERTSQGSVQSARLVTSAGKPFYDVSVMRNGRPSSVEIDAISGEVTTSSPGQPVQFVADVASESPAEKTTFLDSQDLPSAANIRLYVGSGTGQVAGMHNTILRPKYVIGIKAAPRLAGTPELDTHINTYLVYGTVESGNGSFSAPGFQEMRGQIDSVYNFYNHENVTKIGIGWYSEFAVPFQSYDRFYQSIPTGSVYSDEEGETLSHEFINGVDLKLSLADDKLQTTLHNVLFFNGNRIGPNLMTYKPLLGLMWHNNVMILGSIQEPKLSLFTDVDIYFARKNNTPMFNMHDGLGGTKREIFLSYGLTYSLSKDSDIKILSYGFNNLNRGSSNQVPSGFRDGFAITLDHAY
jgi:hypothetical protein